MIKKLFKFVSAHFFVFNLEFKIQNLKLFLAVCCLLFAVCCLYSQQQYLPLNNSINDIVESEIIQNGDNFHSSIKPYRISEISKALNLDSMYSTLNVNTKSMMINRLMNNDILGINDKQHKVNIVATPLLACEGGYDLNNKQKTLDLGIGLNLKGDIGKKLSFSANLFFDNSKYLNYIDSMIRLSKAIPGEGKAYSSQLGYFYKTLTFYLTYSPSKYFNLEIGKGKNFFGDGYRSLLLSDNANSYPYFKITTTFWKLKYVVFFAKLENIDDPALGLQQYDERYTAMHYLSWNITKWCNLSFFEAVMFKGTDSTGKRGFDVNYLNPVIIYRPVEFAIGSPDKEFLGANIDFKIHKKTVLYSQILIGEFIWADVKAMNGYYSNKSGLQFGVKSFDVFNIKNLKFQAEYNYVRPFTYAHFEPETNYSDFNQPLAEPLGANCEEFIGILHYRLKRWQFQLQYNYAVYGTDIPGSKINTPGTNYGQNIFEDYQFFAKKYGNYVGQGVRNVLQYREVNVSYTLNARANIILEAGFTNRSQVNYLYSQHDNIIYLGIKTLFDNQYFDF